MSLRIAANRVSVLRVAPTMVRGYAPGDTSGATARSAGWQEREQAKEGQYIRQKEEEALKLAREKLKQAQAAVDEQQKKVDNIKEK